MPGKRPPATKQRPTYKIITILTFVVLTIYLMGYIATFLRRPSIGVESVRQGTLDVPVSFNGIIVRDEQVVNSTLSGQVTYYYANGDRLKKGAAVCQVRKADDSASLIESQIANIDKNILSLQKERADISLFKEDIDAIEDKLANVVYSYSGKFNDGNLSGLYEFRSQLDSQILRRNEIWLFESTKSASELAAEKTQYENQLSDSVRSVSTENSGILSLYIDGYEQTLTPDTRTEITKEQTQMRVEPNKLLSTALTVMEEDPIFKVVKSNTWYIVGYLPNSVTANWKTGDGKTLTGIINEEEKSVKMVVDSLTAGETETCVVFRTDRNLLDFLTVRTLSLTIKSDTYEGLKIPNQSIVEKALIKIPLDCIQDSLDTSNVIRRGNSGDELVPIKALKSDEQFVYILQDFETLKLGDVLLKGTGEAAEEYTLKDVVTYQGVYVVNSSIAAFTVVDIMGQNVDYAIVRPSTLSSGLQIYDNIVSDATTVQEGDEIY